MGKNKFKRKLSDRYSKLYMCSFEYDGSVYLYCNNYGEIRTWDTLNSAKRFFKKMYSKSFENQNEMVKHRDFFDMRLQVVDKMEAFDGRFEERVVGAIQGDDQTRQGAEIKTPQGTMYGLKCLKIMALPWHHEGTLIEVGK